MFSLGTEKALKFDFLLYVQDRLQSIMLPIGVILCSRSSRLQNNVFAEHVLVGSTLEFYSHKTFEKPGRKITFAHEPCNATQGDNKIYIFKESVKAYGEDKRRRSFCMCFANIW